MVGLKRFQNKEMTGLSIRSGDKKVVVKNEVVIMWHSTVVSLVHVYVNHVNLGNYWQLLVVTNDQGLYCLQINMYR